jgi:alanine racemase
MTYDARCWVDISLSRIRANYRAVRDAVAPGAQVMGVVKANAYGHGAVEVARALCDEGAPWLAVTSVEEGVRLRDAGIACRILVMAGVMAWEQEAVRGYRLTPVVHELDELKLFEEHGPVDVHLKIDTGMHRLGIQLAADQIAAAVKSTRNVRVEGMLSHFASAADFISNQTVEQIRAFNDLAAQLAQLGIKPEIMHLASTNAIAYPRRDAWLQLVRPGHAIYGYVSPPRGHGPAAVLTVKPALSWYARVISVKDIPRGSKVGYGGSYYAAAPMRIAVLAAGYADGIPHRLSNKGRVIAGGQFSPMVGTVSMDLTTIDVTHSPNVRVGDAVTLLGTDGGLSIDAQQIARTAGTISYSVLCGISSRVKRFYVD